jgi:hypothetical protein
MILDRVGLTVEVLPHLLGANRRPTGERGLYATGVTARRCLTPTRSAP